MLNQGLNTYFTVEIIVGILIKLTSAESSFYVGESVVPVCCEIAVGCRFNVRSSYFPKYYLRFTNKLSSGFTRLF